MITICDTNRIDLANLPFDTSNGLGVITPLKAQVVEEINSIYELNFQVSVDEKRFNELAIGGVVKCNAGHLEGKQLFRIEKISKARNGVVSIYAPHITYDLSKTVVLPFNATGINETISKLKSKMVGQYPFTVSTNISNTSSSFVNEIPRSFRECLGGWEGSILDTFKCEYEFNNLNVGVLNKRGQDTSVRIAYGKNLVDLTQDENIENVFNACIGYATTNDNIVYSDVQYLASTSRPRVKIVDFTSEFDEDNLPSKSALNTMARNYAINNQINIPSVNLTVSFVPLWQTEEYKDIAPLEEVNLGDRLIVDFPKLGVSANARVVKRTWNVLTERYDSIELGDTKANMTTILDSSLGAIYRNMANTNTILGQINSTSNNASSTANQANQTANNANATANEANNTANNALNEANNKVSKSGDTMSGNLTINRTSGQAIFDVISTGGTVSLTSSDTGNKGVYSRSYSKWLLYENSSGAIYLNDVPMDVVNTKVSENSTYISSANNSLYLYRWGKFVFLSGYINNTTLVPSYTKVFTIPNGYRPVHNTSITPINASSHIWLFGTASNGEFSTQGTTLATGNHYFSACWLCA